MRWGIGSNKKLGWRCSVHASEQIRAYWPLMSLADAKHYPADLKNAVCVWAFAKMASYDLGHYTVRSVRLP
jgi:hypothetical protein